MDLDFKFISGTALFHGCREEEIAHIAEYLNMKTAEYEKGNIIFREGSIVNDIGLVLSGSIQIEHNDSWGNKGILGIAKAGEIFAESYACVPNEAMMVDVIANENCKILFINVPRFFCLDSSYECQSQILQNLVVISARKNLQLSRRSLHTSPKTIRGRLFSYFDKEIAIQKSTQIVIPFNRQQLADYLNLDRSALSKELGRMKKDGLIDYHKNKFIIKKEI
jgi:CRP-like cAMP-binding protein